MLPLVREPYLALVKAVLAWSGPGRISSRATQIAHVLAVHARALAGDVQRRCAGLPLDEFGPQGVGLQVVRHGPLRSFMW
ncbi:hypothetical protein DMH15_21965 [Streptomyces sp. WAC 06725]|nr:hypothetical protein DMH15_21965 [Streptomyces sp. WAC 06725]